MNRIHNASIGKIFALPMILVIELLFGVGVYAVLQASTVGIVGEPLSLVFSIFAGAFTAAGNMWIFLYSEYAIADVKAYIREHNEWGVRLLAVYALGALFIGMDILALVYRLQYTPPAGRPVLFGIGLIFAFLPLLLGQILFAMSNRPEHKIVEDIQQGLSNSIAVELQRTAKNLDVHQKLRLMAGEKGVVKEHLDEQKALKEGKKSLKEGRKNSSTVNSFFTPALENSDQSGILQGLNQKPKAVK